LRERLINGGDLEYEEADLDSFYFEEALAFEKELQNAKVMLDSGVLKATIDFINLVDSKEFCSIFDSREDECRELSDGILDNGYYQALGTFLRKFSEIKLSNSNYDISDLKRIPIFEVFFTAQENYFSVINDRLILAFQDSLDSYFVSRRMLVAAGFIAFTIFVIVLVTMVRGKLIQTMCDELRRIKGILNLMPFKFFENNKELVDNLIRQLKD